MGCRLLEDAVRWCAAMQTELLLISWPEGLMQWGDCREQRDPETGAIIWRGLRVRMGMSFGRPSYKKPLNTGTPAWSVYACDCSLAVCSSPRLCEHLSSLCGLLSACLSLPLIACLFTPLSACLLIPVYVLVHVLAVMYVCAPVCLPDVCVPLQPCTVQCTLVNHSGHLKHLQAFTD